MKQPVRFTLNGEPTELAVASQRKLLWILRGDLNLTGTKYGCGKGQCGSCTVLVNGKAVRSCRLTVGAIEGKEVTTIEGLASNGDLHPVQEAFIQEGALQCGFCTAGMILNAVGVLREKPYPTREDIVRGMEGNLCRCGAHARIMRAIETAAGEAKGVR